MAIKRESLHDLIEKLPNEKLNDVYKYLKEASEPVKASDFEKAFEYTIENYDEALKGLKDR